MHMSARAILSGLAIGLVFGVALEKAKVYVPLVIRQQMLFSNYLMLKVFLTSTAVGMLFVSIAESVGITERKDRHPIALGFGVLRGYGGNVFGGLLIGFGMTLSGACPGTLFVQLGAGIESARYAFVGGILGALIFGYAHKPLTKVAPNFMKSSETTTIDRIFGHNYVVFSIVASAIIFAGTVLLDTYVSAWFIELKPVIKNMTPDRVGFAGFDLSPLAWPPIVAGVIIGLLQIPSFLISDNSLGTSSSYAVMAGLIARVFDKNWREHSPYLAKFTSFTGTWQLSLVIGLVLGAYLSASISAVQLIATSISPIAAIAGGFMLVVGSRFAGGCTSGHGISGMAQLYLPSIVTVISMFAGGILLAVLTLA